MDINIGLSRTFSSMNATSLQAPQAIGSLPDLTIPAGQSFASDLSTGFTGSELVISIATSSDPLPSGLTLSATGILSGLPSATASPATIIVEASNSQGSAESGFQIVVFALDFNASLTGLNDNLQYGLSAETGQVLTAVADGYTGSLPSSVSYQWKTVESGAIAGATQSTYAPSSDVHDGESLFCKISPEGYPEKDSSGFVIRQVAPTLVSSLQDEIFELGSGLQSIDMAPSFSGQGLSYSVVGPAGVVINATTGVLDVPTSTMWTAETITVTATNSGGDVSGSFDLTIENTSSQMVFVTFGANTAAGEGRVPVTGNSIISGDPSGHWQVSNGFLSPSAVGAGTLQVDYELAMDDGAIVDVAVVANERHVASINELNSAYAVVPLDGSETIWLRARDYRGDAGRWAPTPRAFSSTQAIRGEGFIPGARPKFNSYGVLFPAIFFNGVQNTELHFLDLYSDPTISGGNGANRGVLLCETGDCDDCGIYDSRITSRSLSALASDGSDHTDNTMVTLGTGIINQVSHGINTTNATVRGFRAGRCYIKDVARGIFTNASDSPNRASRFFANDIEDVYYNFWTFTGGANNVEFLDNTAMHAWASGGPGEDNGSPHASTGMSGDSPAAPNALVGVRQLGNVVHVGWHRAKLHEDNGWPVFVPAATGAKTNDPNQQGSYVNHETRFNLILTNGQSLMAAGVSGWDVSHNLVMSTPDVTGTVAGFYPDAVLNMKAANNVYGSVSNGEFDGEPGYVRTIDTAEAYGQLQLTSTGENGLEDMLTAHPVKGFSRLELEEVRDAYTPLSASALAQKAVGPASALYSGDGVHSFTHSLPAATGGVPTRLSRVRFDGSTRVSGDNSGFAFNTADNSRITVLLALHPEAANDGQNVTIFVQSNAASWIRRLADGTLEFRFKDPAGTTLEWKLNSAVPVLSGQWSYVAATYDTTTGQSYLAINGVPDPLASCSEHGAEMLHASATSAYVGANYVGSPTDYFQGGMELIAIRFGEALDLSTSSGLGKVFASDGTFRNLGNNGETAFSEACQLYLTGAANSWDNQADIGSWTRAGLSDWVVDTTGPVIVSSDPLDDAVDVPLDTVVSVTFDEAIAFASGTITLRSNDGAWVDAEVFDVSTDVGSGPGSVSISGNVLTLHPSSDLLPSRPYALRIDAGAIADASGNLFAGISNDSALSFTSAGPAGPQTINLTPGTFIDMSATLPIVVSEFVWAARVQVNATGLVPFGYDVAAAANSFLQVNAGDADLRLESSTGSALLAVFNVVPWVEGETKSVFLRVASGSIELLVDGVTVLSSAATFSFVKMIRTVNATNSLSGSSSMSLIGGLWIGTQTGVADASSGLTYGDLFDASHQPVFDDSAISGFAPALAFVSADDVNAYPGTTGSAS
ncbi:MAG: Ig-like domain-containing protein [Arenibacterium sp.]